MANRGVGALAPGVCLQLRAKTVKVRLKQHHAPELALGQRWLTAERIALEQNAIGWTMWDYQGGFGVVTKKDGTTAEDDAVLRALGLRPH